MSVCDTGEETSIIEACVDNETDSERKIYSDAVVGYCGEKYGTNSKIETSADTKYFMLEV